MKLVFAQSSRVMAIGGTYTTSGKFKHTSLLATGKDTNSNIILYAMGIIDVEGKHWFCFLSQLLQDFEGMQVCVSDFEKGVESHDFQVLLELNRTRFSR